MRLLLLALSAMQATAWNVKILHGRSLAPTRSSTSALILNSERGPALSMMAEGGQEGTEVPFEIRFSLGNVVSGSGFVLLAYCLISYLLSNGKADIVQTLGFVYAIPALVGGLALKYAELPPVPVRSKPGAEEAREAKGTEIQKKIMKDLTRYTYGDAHMELQLRALKLAPRGMGPPEIKQLVERVTPDGAYSLSMIFYAPNTPYRIWKDRAPRYSNFFGPGVRAQVKKASGEQRLVQLTLITVQEGESTECLEELEDGTLVPVLTAAEEERQDEFFAAPSGN